MDKDQEMLYLNQLLKNLQHTISQIDKITKILEEND